MSLSWIGRDLAARASDIGLDGIGGALPDLAPVQVHPAHPGLRGERHEGGAHPAHVPLPDRVLLLGEHDDAAALRGLVGQRGELGGVGQVALGDARGRQERGGLAVAERDRARLVEQQHVDVPGRLDGPA
jgi:hypothetical protein